MVIFPLKRSVYCFTFFVTKRFNERLIFLLNNHVRFQDFYDRVYTPFLQ